MSLHQNNKLLLVHVKRCFVSHWPPASEIGMLLITNFLELGVVAEISRTLADRQHAISCRHPAMALRSRFQKGIFVAWQGNSMVCVNQTRPHCVNQMRKTQSKALAECNCRGTAWERHGMYESALRVWNTVSWNGRNRRLSVDAGLYTVMLQWQLLCLETQ
jgi:hypothetical protein